MSAKRVPPSASKAFEAWVSSQQEFRHSETAEIYATVWQGWLSKLPSDVEWHAATRDHVLAFLDGPAPGLRRRRPPKDSEHMSAATRYRYYRVLRGVYKHAEGQKWLSGSDPTLLGELTPGQEDETRQAQVLPPGVLRLLRNPEHLCRLIPARDGDDWRASRDRALVALLAHCGPTTAELQSLTGESLREGGMAMSSAEPPAELPGVNGKPVFLQIGEGGDARTVEVPRVILPLLRAWLKLRHERLTVHAARMLAHPEHHTIPKDSDAPLFVSRQPPRCVPGEPALPLPALDERVLYRTVRSCLEAAYATPEARSVIAPKQRLAFGAAIIRNTLIAHWLATEKEASTVLVRAGLEGTRSLRVGPLQADRAALATG